MPSPSVKSKPMPKPDLIISLSLSPNKANITNSEQPPVDDTSYEADALPTKPPWLDIDMIIDTTIT